MEINIKDLDSPKQTKQPNTARKKVIKMNEPPKFNLNLNSCSDILEDFKVPKKESKQYFLGKIPDELKDNAKKMIIRGASLPAGIKAPILQKKLDNSKYTNDYLDKYLMLESIGLLNDHFKMLLVYGFNYMDSILTSVQQINNQPKQENISS